MNLNNALIEWLAARLKVPADALQLFKAAHSVSGLDKQNLPIELIPLNTRQIARGVLNFTVLQSSPGWVLPFWAERQYDPADPAFVPRSHLGLSINVTHRNWTAIGNPDCSVEPIVDPRGLVTPFPGGWSIDVWMKVDNTVVFPSKDSSVQQSLLDDLPIVETRVRQCGMALTVTAYTERNVLVLRATVQNVSRRQRHVRIGFGLRPFNPEGISLLHRLEFKPDASAFAVERNRRVAFSEPPDLVCCSTYEEGDSAAAFVAGWEGRNNLRADCPTGLANGYAAFTRELGPGISRAFECSCLLSDRDEVPVAHPSLERVRQRWETLLASGATVDTPDTKINSLLRASHTTLLMLTDGGSITPGPATYHQFWFRDAAYMLLALNRFGHFSVTRSVIESFPSRQDRSGYFRSQQGEWDSNGQALWTIWQYALLSGDRELPASHFDHLMKGVRWIGETRLTKGKHSGKPYYGLLPAGLSAEHLGLSDFYFWDNFWSVAGIEAFARICRALSRPGEERLARGLSRSYRQDIENAIYRVQKRFNLREIPASPTRGIDHRMVGTCCAWYPLQIFPPDDARMLASLRTLTRRYFHKGLFFQEFIHSGMNPYLTLHVAHSWLYAADRQKLWSILKDVASNASPTLNFPEALHPLTGGGSMGDGHHGWVAAEIVLALRDMFVYESWHPERTRHDLYFLAGVPARWIAAKQRFSFKRVPVPEGILNLELSSSSRSLLLTITFERAGFVPSGRWIVKLPAALGAIRVNKREVPALRMSRNETSIELPAGASRIVLTATM